MKKIIILSLVALPLFSQLANADVNEKAKELIKVMEITKQLDESQKQIGQFMDQMVTAQGLSGEETEEAKAIARKSMESSFETMKTIDWETMFGDIYASVFTEEEIQALIDFYKSPIGKKYLDKQPELMAATMQKMQGEMAKLMPKIQADVAKAIEEAKK
ncbi:MAG: DUF2059 domain-containing protein [Pontiella sp.]|nr:DUF2059 domain-containing protein [Pontiella sp.]